MNNCQFQKAKLVQVRHGSDAFNQSGFPRTSAHSPAILEAGDTGLCQHWLCPFGWRCGQFCTFADVGLLTGSWNDEPCACSGSAQNAHRLKLAQPEGCRNENASLQEYPLAEIILGDFPARFLQMFGIRCATVSPKSMVPASFRTGVAHGSPRVLRHGLRAAGAVEACAALQLKGCDFELGLQKFTLCTTFVLESFRLSVCHFRLSSGGCGSLLRVLLSY